MPAGGSHVGGQAIHGVAAAQPGSDQMNCNHCLEKVAFLDQDENEGNVVLLHCTSSGVKEVEAWEGVVLRDCPVDGQTVDLR